MCDRHMWGEPDGLRCTATGPHEGHRYESSRASELGEGGNRRKEGEDE